MKMILKTLAITVAAALILTTAPANVNAEHQDRDNIGPVVVGIAAIGLIAAIASHHHSDAHVYVEHCAPPPPPPPAQCWIPGHYETRREQVCIPGYWDTVVTPAEYGWVRHGHRQQYVLLKPECVQRVWVPERKEWRDNRVWIEGHYEATGGYARAW